MSKISIEASVPGAAEAKTHIDAIASAIDKIAEANDRVDAALQSKDLQKRIAEEAAATEKAMADMADMETRVKEETLATNVALGEFPKTLKEMETGINQLKVALTQMDVSSPAFKQLAGEIQRAEGELKRMQTAHVEVTKSSAGSGRAILELSRGLEDLQYGVSGVLNNIPGLLQALGQGAGLAGIISILSVGIFQLVKHLDLGGPALDALGEAAGRAAVKAGESAMAADKHREAMDLAKESANQITEAIAKEDQALQDELAALKNSADATANLDKQKKELLQSERDLALARNAASGDDEITKLKRKHEINNDYSAAAINLEAEVLSHTKARSEAEARLHEEARAQELKRAAEAAAAKQKLEENATRKAAAEGTAGKGKNQLGGLLEALGSLSEQDGGAFFSKQMLGGIEEKGDSLTQAKILLANLERFSQDLKAGKFAGTQGSKIDYEEGTGQGFARNKARIESIIQQIESGAAEAKASEAAKPQLEANSKAYGEPDSYQKKAESEAKAAAAARNKAAEASARLLHDSKINQMKAETETLKQAEEVTKAQKDAEKRKADELRKTETEKQRKAQATTREDYAVGESALKVAGGLPNTETVNRMKQAALRLEAGDHTALTEVLNLSRQIVSRIEAGVTVNAKTAAEVANLKRRLANLRTDDNTGGN